MANVIEILVTGRNLTKPAFDEAARNGRQIGQQVGAEFTKGVGDKVKQDLPPKIEDPIEESGRKGGEKGGQAAGAGFSKGMSPLILGAFAAAATVGPDMILAGTATAVIGAGALITKSNATLSGSYQHLGSAAADMVTTATAPLVPQLLASVGILQRGIGQVGPQLQSVFAAVAPDVTDIASGLVSLVSNTLPGMASGLRAIAPYASDLAVDFGKIGSGLGGFLQGLGGGAAGGMAGFNALSDVIKALLTDVGQITGDLANGLGPALHDVADVALPVASALTAVVHAVPPGVIRAAADATLALFLAFKGASLAGLLSEGASFLTFLKGAAVAEDAAATSAKAWGVAMDAVPLVAVGAAIAGLAVAADKLGGSGDHTSVSVDKFTSSLLDAANGSQSAQDGVVKLATSFALMNGTMGMSLQGLKDIDTSLTNLYQSNPAAAAKEFDAITASLKAQGQSADQIAKEFPQYTKAVADAQLQAKLTASSTQTLSGSFDVLTQKLTEATLKSQESARQSAATTLAALGLSDGNGTLATSLNISLQAFTLASRASSAYKTSLDALFNKYADYSQAQATFTEDLAQTAGQLARGKDAVDLNTAAGAKNFTMLKQLSDANEQVAQSFITQGGSVDDANKKLQAGAQKIDDLARKAGFSAGQVAQLNTELYGTANIKDITVNIGADTSPAVGAVRSMIEYFDHQAAYIQVYASPGSTGGKQLLAHGGIVGAAAVGGPRGNMTWVGEHGPELAELPPGTMVRSNPDSMRIAGQQGAPGRLEVEWVGGNGGDEFLTWLRGNIRIRGGNVQTVLGH